MVQLQSLDLGNLPISIDRLYIKKSRMERALLQGLAEQRVDDHGDIESCAVGTGAKKSATADGLSDELVAAKEMINSLRAQSHVLGSSRNLSTGLKETQVVLMWVLPPQAPAFARCRAELKLLGDSSNMKHFEKYDRLYKYVTTKAFLPTMLEINHGHIVTVASSLGLFSTAGVEDYCASKFGVVGFHESLSHELKAAEKDGIKTTLVCPYLVDTGMFRGCRIRKEIEPFLPPLKPDYCVKQAMKAILTDQPMICTPRLMYIVTFMKR
ncbi:hypothetical protein P7K49_027066 [Saguinus oedipus]|uniref:NADP-retinol dehydrogenase n=1 Tax=Saguinus oedipus TaxID=9490 RepID=A0ABQ9UFW2_SAGOE|nr:hypothetical protein P7K49_027066 [Saguinus oedipus]